mmetsp:Transcript_4441/g.6525  ORF Transcript_4441/g.6525 Transcript_4441/m.6525 type:complete len:320 (+) Transcript_4441:93-1052(+)
MASQRTAGSIMLSLQRRFITSGSGSRSGSSSKLYSYRSGYYGRPTAITTMVTPSTTNHQIQSIHHQRINNILPSSRSMAYASVNHEMEYKDQMEGRHGEQLELAYEEGMKYEHEAVDPFELYKIEEDEDYEDYDEMELVDDDDGNDNDGNYEEEEEDDDDGDDDTDDVQLQYGADGHLKRSKAEIASFRAGAPAGGKFAIINLNGSQHKVTVDDIVIVNKLKPVSKWSVGSTHTLTNNNDANDVDDDDGQPQVLLLGSQEKTLIGLPFVNGGEVDVMVEEITRDKKVIVFKKKRRKNYRRKNGFRREVTFLRVLDIRFP